uniref:Cytochrome c domain-containing protein n=1 Tax=Solibacter usitatus (strain Ellin6076) TaxID=234267 RepID=Q02AF0_SOLUE
MKYDRAVARLSVRVWAAVAVCLPASSPAADRVDFSRDVRPILSDRCFTCHGPDEATRKAGLRLDTEAGALAPRGGHRPIVPGDASASEVMKRVAPERPAMRMPPPYSDRKPLTDKEIATLRAWIEQGARWQSHWSFTAPVRPELPPVRNAGWVRNPIDRFVLARLEREGLTPAAAADRARLLRRVTFDLTGLPPTLGELDAFLEDQSADSYEKVVDRLLASPRYGERMAVDWLDAARYADTHGYQVDPEKEMWPWRDWVIDAFNRNMPYDRFTVEQIAGDLLPNATLEQKIATGFQRNHRINSETGSIAEEFQAENVVDRVSTLGAVWLGLTVGCARCHDHKYDPLTTREFYSLYAFFNNVDEVGNGGPRDGRGNHKPYLRLPAPELEAQAAAKEREIAAARDRLVVVENRLAPGLGEWERGALTHQAKWEVLRPTKLSAGGGVTLAQQADGSVLAGGAMPASSIYEIAAGTSLANITAFRLELLPDASLPSGGSGRGDGGKAVVTLFEVKAGARKIDLSHITADFKSEESELDLVLRPADQLKRGWGVNPETARPHYAVIEPARMTTGGEFTIRIGNEYEGAPVGRFRISVTSDEFPEVMPEAIGKILRTDAGARTDKDRVELRRYFLAHPYERRHANEEVVKLEAEKRAIENKIPTTMVMEEMATPRDSFVLLRGQYDKPGEKVAPGVPAFLPPLPAGAPANRLTLARWLVDAANPLTARVAVNRYWQAYFGTGLVKTTEDFGAQGEAPSHPELLDWLATEFVRTGWDVKAMQRLIVTSATYRQASTSNAVRERDPENRLLARGPRVRLAAEMIRDQALAMAGLLNDKMGGSAVKIYQPEGLWEQLSAFQGRKLFERSKGPDLWRRSVYTYWKRTVPPPSLTIFDAPTREFCVVRRQASSTPLQALALLNDEMYIEAARRFAERMMKEGGATPAARLGWAFRLATSRLATPGEVAILERGLGRRLAQYRADPTAAERLLAAGESPRDMQLDAVELAAYTTAASVILNLDEVITRQ